MGVPANTYTTYAAKGQREQLSNMIYDISPEETIFMSSIGRGPRADAKLFEWQTDTLEPASDSNAHLEGDDPDFTAITPSVRLGNYQQISRKTLVLSDSLEEVDKAGRRSELAYQIARKGIALKRDQEKILLANQGGDPGAEALPRKMATLLAFIKTNVNMGGGGVNPSYTSGVPGSPRTDGAQRAFTQTIGLDVVQKVWNQGGKPRVMIVGPFNKTVVSSTFTGIAQRTVDVARTSKATIIQAADIWVTDFGTVRVIPTRFQRERDAIVYDPEMASVRALRAYRVKDLAKTGDNTKKLLITEWSLQVNNEAAFGLAADLNVS